MLKQEQTILTGTVLERAVLYARVSGDDTRDKKEGRNLKGQLEMGREYATGKGYNIVDQVAEDAKKFTSGADIDLPGLNKIRSMARAGQFDVLVVRELDRLSRELAKQIIIENELKNAGVRIEYVLGEYADTPEGRLQKHIKATIAEYEREKIKERARRGKRNKAKAGKVIRSRRIVYGYDYDEENETLVINEFEAGIVRSIFDMLLNEGMGTEKIAKELPRLGVPTPTGKSKTWCGSTVYRFLTNPTYTGVWQYNKNSYIECYSAKKSRKVKRLVENPEEDRIDVEIPAIIDRETFEAAQEQLSKNKKRSKRNTKRHYLMSRRITCGKCGAAVGAHSLRSKKVSKTYSYYRCAVRVRPQRYTHTCDLPTFTVKEVDEKVWAELEQYILYPEKLRKAMKRYQALTQSESSPLVSRLATIDDLLERWKKEFDNAIAELVGEKPRSQSGLC